MNTIKSIKPNIFLFKNLSNEDHFTNSLGYILNLMPIELGNRFVNRLAVLSDCSPGHFGDFVEATFTGHYFQNEDSTSKPDLIIITTKTKLFFEIKLKAPLSKDQLERHFNDVDRQDGYLALISNTQSNVSDKLFRKRNYLKPVNQSHFFWSQFETLFNVNSRKGSLSALLLSDFSKSLRYNGIKRRQISGATENLYTNGSDAENLVLDKLKALLRNIGFKAWRRSSEFTLRVNIEKSGMNPLLNPRIYSSGESLNENFTDECLIIHCYVTDDDKDEIFLVKKLSRLMLSFPEIRILDSLEDESMYHVYIPLKFILEATSYQIDWTYLECVWYKIYSILTRELTTQFRSSDQLFRR